MQQASKPQVQAGQPDNRQDVERLCGFDITEGPEGACYSLLGTSHDNRPMFVVGEFSTPEALYAWVRGWLAGKLDERLARWVLEGEALESVLNPFHLLKPSGHVVPPPDLLRLNCEAAMAVYVTSQQDYTRAEGILQELGRTVPVVHVPYGKGRVAMKYMADHRIFHLLLEFNGQAVPLSNEYLEAELPPALRQPMAKLAIQKPGRVVVMEGGRPVYAPE